MRERHARPPAERAEGTGFVGADEFEKFEGHFDILARTGSMKQEPSLRGANGSGLWPAR